MERKLFKDDEMLVAYGCQHCGADLAIRLAKFNTSNPQIDEEKINKIVMICPSCGLDMGKPISITVSIPIKSEDKGK